MATVSIFRGIYISMFWADDLPPHFHATYKEFDTEYVAVIDINILEMFAGRLPKKQLRLVLAWAELNQEELLANWEVCSTYLTPRKIKPLA